MMPYKYLITTKLKYLITTKLYFGNLTKGYFINLTYQNKFTRRYIKFIILMDNNIFLRLVMIKGELYTLIEL
jgi:hypothetical protein